MNNLRSTRIKISGMGLLVSYEGELVKRALESAGFVVELNDLHPPESVEVMMEHRTASRERTQKVEGIVVIDIDHEPWGG